MTTHPCAQCGHPLPEKVRFCGECGALTEASPIAAAGARTLISTPQPASGSTPTAAVLAAKRTIFGLPALASPPPPKPADDAPAQASDEGAPVQAPEPTALAATHYKTMLGVARPGIAPLHAGEANASQDVPAPLVEPVAATLLPAPPTPRAFGETLAIPAFFVPPPPAFSDPPMPSEPQLEPRGGAPLALAALVAGGLLLVGGAGLAFWWRGPSSIAAQPRIAPDGKDVLHLTCEPNSCKDGTIVSLGPDRSTFVAGQADLPLGDPLHVGENPLSLSINRPGMGRDETVKLVVPVAYRVRADVTTMSGPRPCITIRVQAPPETSVTVDDKPVTLDAAGAGAYVIDESAMTEGPADESRVVAIDVPYVVVPKGRPPETGTVSARLAVAPLRVDAPSTGSVIDDDAVLLAGRAAKGANVTVEGVPVAVGPDGTFETTVAIGAVGDRTIESRAATGALAPRTVYTTVTRVANLAEAAAAFEARAPIGYDAAMRNIAAAKTGQLIVVEGEVVDARGSGHRTLVLVDDHRGCAKGPCLARVILNRDLLLAHGALLRAYGRVTRAFRTPSAQTVPEVEALFILQAGR